ncbi:MAG: hypothetical protein RBU45_01120 [Myxococcota bacterium]|nr:hypothetical protein [Myxococcota bacterium]
MSRGRVDMARAGRARLLLLGLLLPACASPAATPAVPPLVLVQVPVGSPAAAWSTTVEPAYPAGTRLLLLDPAGGPPRVLSPGLDVAAWPAPSPDGRQVLFAGRRGPADPFTLWISDLTGAPPQPFPAGPGSCTNPRWIAADHVVMRCAASLPALTVSNPGALWVVGPGKLPPRRITFGVHPQFSPEVLPDGRLVYGERVLDRPPPEVDPGTLPGERIALRAVDPDGAGAERYHDRLLEPTYKLRVKRGGEGRLLIVGGLPGETRPGPGRLFQLATGWPAVHAEPLRPDLGGPVVGAAALPGGGLLLCRQVPDDPVFSLQWLPSALGGEPQTWHRDPAFHVADVEPVLPWSPPSLPLSTLDGSGRGWLLLLDPSVTEPGSLVSVSRYGLHSAVLLAPEPAPAPPEEGLPDPDDFLTTRRLPPPADPYAEAGGYTPETRRRPLGEFAVQPDGSFLVALPADTPLTLRLLGAGGTYAGDVPGWFWLRPGEIRSCLGCHEDPGRLPPNEVFLATTRPPSVLGPVIHEPPPPPAVELPVGAPGDVPPDAELPR